MRTRTLAATVAGLILTSAPVSALAGILVDVQFVTRSFLPPERALAGFTGLQVDIQTDDGALISAVDVRFEGPLHQRWDPGIDCPFLPDFVCPTPQGPPANGRGDSHLTTPNNPLIAAALFEDNTGDGSPLSPSIFKYGLGTTLSGAWGIAGPSQATRASIAYLVIPDGQSVQFDWAIATRGTTGETFLGTTVIFIPEPSAVAILLVLSLSLTAARVFS